MPRKDKEEPHLNHIPKDRLNLFGKIDTKGKDPDELIQQFDEKLSEINAVLEQYKEDLDRIPLLAGLEPFNSERRKSPQKLHRNVTGNSNGPGSESSSRTIAGQRNSGAPIDERTIDMAINQFKKLDPIQRRAMSALPKSSRAMFNRLSVYRSDPDARAELRKRAAEAVKWKAENGSRQRTVQTAGLDFIKVNRESLQKSPQPYYDTFFETEEGIRGVRRSSMSATTCRSAMGLRSSVSASGSPTTLDSQRGGVLRPSTLAASVERKGRLLSSSVDAGVVTTYTARPKSCVLYTSYAPSPKRMEQSEEGTEGMTEQDDSADSPVPLRSSRAGGPLTPSLKAAQRCVSPELLEASRNLRINLTSRPASGGSPTRHRAFVSDHLVAQAMKKEHAEVVRQRWQDNLVEMKERTMNAMEKRERRHEDERLQREAEEAAEELRRRQLHWGAIVHYTATLKFLKERIVKGREYQPVISLQKQSAIRIATWFKSILYRRRSCQVLKLMRRMKDIIHPRVEEIQRRMRERCAARLISFMEHIQESQSTIAKNAVKNFLGRLRWLQHRWRTTVMLRRTQDMVFYNYFHRFERVIVKKNLRLNHQSEALKAILVSGRKMPKGAAAKGTDPRSLPLTTRAKSAAPGGFRGGKGAEIEDPELERALAFHMEMLPDDVRKQITSEAVLFERRRFYHKLDQYRSDVEVYKAQIPMEELRIKLLRDAGLEAEEKLKPPTRPRMSMMLPRSKLKLLLKKGIDQLNQQRQEEARLRQEEAELEADLAAITGQPGPNRSPSPNRHLMNPSPHGHMHLHRNTSRRTPDSGAASPSNFLHRSPAPR